MWGLWLAAAVCVCGVACAQQQVSVPLPSIPPGMIVNYTIIGDTLIVDKWVAGVGAVQSWWCGEELLVFRVCKFTFSRMAGGCGCLCCLCGRGLDTAPCWPDTDVDYVLGSYCGEPYGTSPETSVVDAVLVQTQRWKGVHYTAVLFLQKRVSAAVFPAGNVTRVGNESVTLPPWVWSVFRKPALSTAGTLLWAVQLAIIGALAAVAAPCPSRSTDTRQRQEHRAAIVVCVSAPFVAAFLLLVAHTFKAPWWHLHP